MASQVELVSFEDTLAPALREYADMLRQVLETEGFA
jgi:hypothetical protein